MLEGIKVKERDWRALGGALALTGALALAACGGEGKGTDTSAAATTPPTTAFSGPIPTQPGEITLTFDDLGGGSSIIKVYPGVGNTSADKRYNGTYNDGDTVSAECKTEGRTVNSNPNLGEEKRSSAEWIKLTTPVAEYATAVYVENPDKLLGQLPEC